MYITSEHLTNKLIGILVQIVIKKIIFLLNPHSPSEPISLKYCKKSVLEENIKTSLLFVYLSV
jgi:hypothetical protein